MLKFIDSLADKIAGKVISQKKKTGYISFEIQPYQENEFGVAYRE